MKGDQLFWLQTLTLLAFSALLTISYSQSPCGDDEILCNGTINECIRKEYLCDGTFIDCRNGWDEYSCPCPNPGYYRCPDSMQCILERWVCDNEYDCLDGGEEKDCPCDGFKCSDYICIPSDDVCDGYHHCSNDEDNCDK